MTIGTRTRALALAAALLPILPACSSIRAMRGTEPLLAPHLGDAAKRTSSQTTENVIVVTIDGVRWQDVFGGVDASLAADAGMPESAIVDAPHLLPNLYALARRGLVSGAPGYGPAMEASGPNFVSLPGYLEIFSGSTRVGCTTNLCDATTSETFLDRARDRLATKDTDVAAIGSWETLANAVSARPERITVSVGKHGGASRDNVRMSDELSALLDEGAKADPAPGDGDYRPDRITAPIALRYLEAARPRVLAVGLGDTDEHAHAGDYARYVDALRHADTFLGELTSTLRRMGSYGERTSVVVTCDHGRAEGFRDHGWDVPESRRVWMVAAGGAVPALGYAGSEGARRLADIAPTLETLLGMDAPATADRGTPIAAIRTARPSQVLAQGGSPTLLR
jgi:hypothetical protein